MRAINAEDIGIAAMQVLEPEHRVSTIQEAEGNIQEAKKPLVSDDTRVEVIMLIVQNDRQEALEAIGGLFRTKYPFKLTLYENSLNTRNTSKIWNKLIQQSTCEYILLLDSDCVPQNDILTPMMEVMKRHPEAVAVGPVAGKTSMPHVQQVFLEDRDEFYVEGHISGSCFLFRKSVVEEMGGFDEEYLFYGQDSDLWERCSEQNKKKYVCRRALAFHGKDEKSASVSATRATEDGVFDMWKDSCFAQCLFFIKKKLRLGINDRFTERILGV